MHSARMLRPVGKNNTDCPILSCNVSIDRGAGCNIAAPAAACWHVLMRPTVAMTSALLALGLLAPATSAAAAATTTAGCTDAADCSYNGECSGGSTCACRPQWTGPHCASLSLLPTSRSAGLHGADEPATPADPAHPIGAQPQHSYWGSSVLKGDDGMYHMW